MDRINFGASSYQKAKTPSEFDYAYLMPWSDTTIQALGKLGLPFEPYMVNNGKWYVISCDVIHEGLTQLASIILSVKDRVVEKCSVAVDGKSASDVGYSDVFMSLVRSGITHIPPDLQSARRMTELLHFTELDLIDRLGEDFGVERLPTPRTMVTLTGVWDTAQRLKTSISDLKRVIKQCETTKDGEKGEMITKIFVEHGNMRAQFRASPKGIGIEPKRIN